MQSEILVAIFSLAGTLIGTLGGIIASNKLVEYRLKQLEKKVEKHNNVVERMAIAENNIKVVNHRIEDLEHIIEKAR